MDSGKSPEQIAKKLGVPLEQVFRWKRRKEIGLLCQKVTDKEILTYMRHNPKKTYREVAYDLGVHITTISNCLIKAGTRKIREKLQNDDAVREYFEAHPEKTNREIGEHFGGITASHVGYILHRLGLRRPERVPSLKDEDLVAYIDEHPKQPYREVAAHFGVSTYYVRLAAQRLGLNKRAREEGAVSDILRLIKESPELTHKALAEKTKTSVHFVEATLKRLGKTDYWKNGRRKEAKIVQRFLTEQA